MNGLLLFLATFLAATIEGVEIAAILVGVGTARGWRNNSLPTPARHNEDIRQPLDGCSRSQALRGTDE